LPKYEERLLRGCRCCGEVEGRTSCWLNGEAAGRILGAQFGGEDGVEFDRDDVGGARDESRCDGAGARSDFDNGTARGDRQAILRCAEWLCVSLRKF